MSKKFLFLISFVLVLGLAGYAAAIPGDLTNPALVPATGQAPVIDGVKEDLWSDSNKYSIARVTLGAVPTANDLSSSWWAMWDSQNFYVFIDVNDANLVKGTGELWATSDSGEVMIDIGNDDQTTYGADDYQYRFAWSPAPYTPIVKPTVNYNGEEFHHPATSMAGVQWYAKKHTGDPNGYTVEMKFPWTTLNIQNRPGKGPPALGSLMGLDFHTNDTDIQGGFRQNQTAWYGPEATWNNPSLDGTVKFVAALPASCPNPPDGAEGVLDTILEWMAGRNAISHDVYFGTTDPPPFIRNQILSNTTYDPPGKLNPATTYYWDINEVNGITVWPGNTWHFTTAPLTAHHPDPCDGDPLVSIDADLSWGAGFYAKTHNVYFGTTSSPPFKGNQPGTTYDPPSGLNYATKYYWQIDEVNVGTPGSPWPGTRWSFTTVSALMGLRGEYFADPNLTGNPVLTRTDYNIDFDWGEDSPDPCLPVDNFSIRWTADVNVPSEGTYTFFVVRSIRPASDSVRLWVNGVRLVNNWPGNDAIQEDSGSIYLAAGPAAIVMEYQDTATTAVAQLSWQCLPSLPREVIPVGRFTLPLLLKAARPIPYNCDPAVSRTPTLTWQPGKYADKVAAGHELYFSSNFNDVNNRTAPKIVRNVPSYTIPTPPAPLKLGQTYYWRVDEANDACEPHLWSGDVWRFTVVNYLVAENFNSYECTSASLCGNKALRAVWTAASGAAVFLQKGSDDANLVHDGNSMLYNYDNYYEYYTSPSEAYANTAALPSGIGSNWTGVKALSLWFYGKAGNDANEQMYVKLTDGASKSAKIIYDGDADDVREAQWHEWNIALQEFVDACSVLNLANVSKITIGFSNPSNPGTGTVYFEDIRVYIPRCMPGTVPDSASGNCLIDYPDLRILTNNWLISDSIIPVNPTNSNLIGWWKLDEGAGTIAADSSINDNDGNLAGDPNSHPQWVAGHIGSALDFNGVHDYVDCSNNVSLNEPNITGKITLAAWVNTRDSGIANIDANNYFSPYITKGDHAYTLQHAGKITTNELEIALYDAGTTWYFASTPVDSSFNGVWHHLAGTYNGSQIKLYVDGELKATTDYVGPIRSATANVNLGKSFDFTDRWYEGALDDVRIYSRALSHGEVAWLAGKTTPFTQPLEQLLTPQNLGIDMYKDGRIDLRDYAVLASKWLEEVLWP